MPHANRLQLSAAANLWEPPTIFLSGFPHAWAAIVSSLFSTTGNQVWISSFLRSRGYRLLSPCHHLPIEHRNLAVVGGHIAHIRSESLCPPWRGSPYRRTHHRTE